MEYRVYGDSLDSLDELDSGRLLDRFHQVRDQLIIPNIVDEDMKEKAPREIVIRIILKPQDENRKICTLAYTVDPKLAKSEPVSGDMVTLTSSTPKMETRSFSL